MVSERRCGTGGGKEGKGREGKGREGKGRECSVGSYVGGDLRVS